MGRPARRKNQQDLVMDWMSKKEVKNNFYVLVYNSRKLVFLPS